MISRVAECCFWLHRYIERAESSARLAQVNHATVLDADIHDAERWRPIIVVLGEQERFEELVGTDAYDDDEPCEDYVTWSQHNPVSIQASFYWARENARMIREIISREMWETVNSCYQWLATDEAHRTYAADRTSFYNRIRSVCAEFQGVCQSSMLHEEPFDFMRLGMLLERANQTARVMDVKHHWLGERAQREPGMETPQEAAQWVALLRLCAAAEPFFKRSRRAPTGKSVAEFLLQDMTFPRAVLHCLDRSRNFLNRIERESARKSKSEASRLVLSAMDRLKNPKIDLISSAGLHEELTNIIDSIAEMAVAVEREFF